MINSEELKKFIPTYSLDRIESFIYSSDDTVDDIIDRYQDNIKISQALYPELATLEVILRNSINAALCKHISETWLEDEIANNTLLEENDYNLFHCMPRGEVMKHLLSPNNVALACCKHVKAFDVYQHCYIAQNIVESCLVSNKTSEITYTFPLYLSIDNSKQKSFFTQNRKPNLNMNIVQELETRLGLSFTPEKENTEGTFAPIDILDYIYGVLHSNKYRTKYKEFLKIDFPRIPYPTNKEYFFNVASLGKHLREIHLMESPEIEEYITSYSISGDNEVIKPEYKNNKVYINNTQYFDNVPDVAWNFYIGGYQPAQKWLKDRRCRILSYDEILHYQKIIKALVLTNDIMQQIDEIVEV